MTSTRKTPTPARAIATALAAWIAASALSSAAEVTVHFSPSVNTLAHIARRLDEAKTSIDVAMYYCTNARLRQALIDAERRGLAIRVILDRSQRGQPTAAYEVLRAHNVPTRIDAREKLHHNKYCVIDSHRVLIGSTNWTDNAMRKNAEALVDIDDPTTAADFAANFATHWQHANYATPTTLPPDQQTTPRQPHFFQPPPTNRRSHSYGTRRRTAVFARRLWHNR